MTDTQYVVVFEAYPHAFGNPALRGRLRAAPEDFRVDEVLGFEPDGEGPHWLLKVEKTGANTDWVAKRLARQAGVNNRDVGYSGLKDRHAVTTQWFSVPAPRNTVDWMPLEAEGIRVLEQHAHRRKLRTGSHKANRFTITVRDLEGDDELDARAARVRAEGVPNYFGPQRFGRNGDNAARGVHGARGGIYISAMRSFLFNAVLAERVESGNWNGILPGEAVQLDGSRSFFVADENDAELSRRLAAFDIHPSGPLWGKGELPSLAEAAALEGSVAGRYPELVHALEQVGLKQERRSLRLPVPDLEFERCNGDAIFRFSLPSGAFATSVFREMLTVHTESAGERDA